MSISVRVRAAGGPQHHHHMSVGMEFYSKNPIGSRPSGLIGLWRMTTQETPPPRTHKEGQGGQGSPNRRKGAAGNGERANRGSTAARPTLTRDWGGPQVKDPVPVVSVNPEADPPQPSAPVRPNWAQQDGETAEEKSQEYKKDVKKPPEEPGGVGVTADRSGEKSSTRSEASAAHGNPRQER